MEIIPMKGERPFYPHLDQARYSPQAKIPVNPGVSHPENSEKPSFLTTLPPEVRNMIYELLFLREEPLVLIDPKRRAEKTRHRCTGFISDAQYTINEPLAPKVIGPAIALLRVCRQVYHECIGTLYSANSFMITAPSNLHSPRMNQVEYAAVWLLQIGDNFNRLRTVCIDVDVFFFCRCYFDEYNGMLNILPLLRIFWKNTTTPWPVRFAHGDGSFDGPLHAWYPDNLRDKYIVSADGLNKLFNTFAVRDPLNIKRYVRFERILSHVFIDHGFDDGTVVFIHSADTNDPSPIIKTTFKIEDSKDRVSTQWSQASRGLAELPERVIRNIVRYATMAADPITFDLDNKTARGLDFNLFRTCHDLRRRSISGFKRFNKSILSMTTTDRVTTFDNFSSLEKWSSGLGEPKSPWACGIRNRGGSCLSAFVLNFHLPIKATLSDLQINVTEFIRLTSEYPRKVQVQICLHSCYGDSEDLAQTNITLQNLERKCFPTLATIALDHPHLLYQGCPELWIDGLGTFIEAIYPADEDRPMRRFPSVGDIVNDETLSKLQDILRRDGFPRKRRNPFGSFCQELFTRVLRKIRER